MRLIRSAKEAVKRRWPPLSVRTILFGTLLFVAALPGVAAVALRVYENTLVGQTEAELIAQGAVLAAAFAHAEGGAPPRPREPRPERPGIDLRTDPVLPAAPAPTPGPPPDPRAAAAGARLAPVAADASAVTLAAVRLLDAHGVVVAGRERGLSYAALPEVARARMGKPVTVLRSRGSPATGFQALLESLSRAATVRVHHVRPVVTGGRVAGLVMLSRSPRGLFLGVYQDRGKIALGAGLIFVTLLVLAGLLSRGIARPLGQLAAATRARGTVPDPPATAAIEIRDLFRDFAGMADRVERRERYLRDFAAAVSHEFKTPLAGIRGALELLDEHGAEMDDPTRRRFIRNAGADADRLARLVQRLLDLARADMASAGDDPRCDPLAVTRAVAARATAPPEVVVFAPDAPVSAPIAADALAAVLETLLDNSRRAGAGRVAITVEPGRLLVADDGPGIDPADRARVFEPFFTGARAAGGTGLGLPIARSLLAAFGATIGLVPSEGGAAFLLELAPDPSPQARSASSAKLASQCAPI